MIKKIAILMILCLASQGASQSLPPTTKMTQQLSCINNANDRQMTPLSQLRLSVRLMLGKNRSLDLVLSIHNPDNRVINLNEQMTKLSLTFLTPEGKPLVSTRERSSERINSVVEKDDSDIRFVGFDNKSPSNNNEEVTVPSNGTIQLKYQFSDKFSEVIQSKIIPPGTDECSFNAVVLLKCPQVTGGLLMFVSSKLSKEKQG